MKNLNEVDELLHSMTKRQLAETIVDDQIKRGVIKQENRDFQINSRLKGLGALKPMSKNELIKGTESVLKR